MSWIKLSDTVIVNPENVEYIDALGSGEDQSLVQFRSGQRLILNMTIAELREKLYGLNPS